MRKTIAITFLAFGFLVLILVAAFTVVQLNVSETGWFEQEFSKLSLADRMGMTLGDLGASIRTLVNYMNGQTETIDVLVTVDGNQVRMFDLDIEITHMREVRDLWQWFIGARNVGVLLAIVLCLAGVVLDGKDAVRNACLGYFWALGLFLVVVAFAGTWAAISFDSFWTFFHRLIFPNSENWLLPAESRMIQMLPSQHVAVPEQVVTGCVLDFPVRLGPHVLDAADQFGVVLGRVPVENRIGDFTARDELDSEKVELFASLLGHFVRLFFVCDSAKRE